MLLCRFSWQSGTSSSIDQTYLSALRTFQVLLGYPDPRDVNSLPRLQMVITGICSTRSLNACTSPPRQRLPITPPILLRLYRLWLTAGWNYECRLLWAASSLYFFRFFLVCELTSSSATYDHHPCFHLSWGDITIDSSSELSILRVLLHHSKVNQLGQGVNVFIGTALQSPICPVCATVYQHTPYQYSNRKTPSR